MNETKIKENEAICNRCGDCCRTLHIRVPLADDVDPEIVRGNLLLYWNLHEGVYGEIQRTKEGKLVIMVSIKTTCSMLQEHKDGTCTCKIYPMRPPICQNWPAKVDAFRSKDIPNCSMLLDPVTGKHEDLPEIPYALEAAESEE